MSATDLSAEIAVRLAHAVEVDDDDNSLPREMMLGRSPPTLRRHDSAARTPSPLRFFCLPFEDLLRVTPHRTVKQKGCIARDSVAPIWTWVSQILLPQESKTYCRNFKAAIALAKHDDSKTHAANFWPIAAAAMRAQLAGEAGRSTARRLLGGNLVLADAEEAALLLGVAPAIVSIQETLAKQAPVLTDQLASALRAIHDELMQTAPDAAPYVAVVAMNRLAHPRKP